LAEVIAAKVEVGLSACVSITTSPMEQKRLQQFLSSVQRFVRKLKSLNPIPEVEAASTTQIPSPFLCVQFNFGEVELRQHNEVYVSVLRCFKSTVFQTT
jgi:hypothetical protein